MQEPEEIFKQSYLNEIKTLMANNKSLLEVMPQNRASRLYVEYLDRRIYRLGLIETEIMGCPAKDLHHDLIKKKLSVMNLDYELMKTEMRGDAYRPNVRQRGWIGLVFLILALVIAALFVIPGPGPILVGGVLVAAKAIGLVAATTATTTASVTVGSIVAFILSVPVLLGTLVARSKAITQNARLDLFLNTQPNIEQKKKNHTEGNSEDKNPFKTSPSLIQSSLSGESQSSKSDTPSPHQSFPQQEPRQENANNNVVKGVSKNNNPLVQEQQATNNGSNLDNSNK